MANQPRIVQCKQCLETTSLPEGADPHAVTWCNCCPVEHHHGQQAESCPGNNGVGHPGEPCNHDNPDICTMLTPPGVPCPGGHCGVGVGGCTVCRPIVHFAVVGDLRFVSV